MHVRVCVFKFIDELGFLSKYTEGDYLVNNFVYEHFDNVSVFNKIEHWKRTEFATQNMPFWHKNYLELVIYLFIFYERALKAK